MILTYRIDLFDTKTNYFEYINKLRNIFLDRKEIIGPGSFFDIFKNKNFLDDQAELEQYLEKTKLKVILLAPWLDYDNYDPFNKKFMDRQDYLLNFTEAYRAIKSIDPEIHILGCIQSNIISLPKELQIELQAGLRQEDKNFEGFRKFNDIESEIIRHSGLIPPNKDILWDSDSHPTGEFNYYGFENEAFEISLVVVPYEGGFQESFLENQVKFLLEDVGLDGIYIDQFNQTDLDSNQRHSYYMDDGVSSFFQKGNKSSISFFDSAIGTLSFQENFTKLLSTQSEISVVNSHPIYPDNHNNIYRFGEGFWGFIEQYNNAGKPRSDIAIAKGHLSSPISIGIPEWLEGPWHDSFTETTLRNLIYFLRNGSLYYYSSIPSEVTDSPAFNVIQNLYPITIKKIGEGWVQGTNKIISSVFLNTYVKSKNKPIIQVFNLSGHRQEAISEIVQLNDGFNVSVKIENWKQIVIIDF